MGSRKENSDRKNKTEKLWIYRMLLCVFLLGAAVSIGMMVRDTIVERRAKETYEQLAKPEGEASSEAQGTVSLTEQDQLVPSRALDWELIHDANEDAYAWIYVPGTEIDYPVLCHASDDEYYLTHNLDLSSGYPGCIFTQSLNQKDFTDYNTVLYGHNMKDGSMFAGLHEFEDNEFFEENSYIYIYTPEKRYAYEIFAACEFDDVHLLINYDFSMESQREQFLREIQDIREMNSHYRDDVDVDGDSQIITLSTCVNGKSDKRYLVLGVLTAQEDIAETDGQ